MYLFPPILQGIRKSSLCRVTQTFMPSQLTITVGSRKVPWSLLTSSQTTISMLSWHNYSPPRYARVFLLPWKWWFMFFRVAFEGYHGQWFSLSSRFDIICFVWDMWPQKLLCLATHISSSSLFILTVSIPLEESHSIAQFALHPNLSGGAIDRSVNMPCWDSVCVTLMGEFLIRGYCPLSSYYSHVFLVTIIQLKKLEKKDLVFRPLKAP